MSSSVASVVSTPCDPTRLLCPWNFPGENTTVGCHFLLHGIFPVQGSNLGPLHCGLILYHLNHQESLPEGDSRVQKQIHLRGHGNSAIAYLVPGRSSGVSTAAQRVGPRLPLPLPAPPASVSSEDNADSPWVAILASSLFHSKVSFPTFLGVSLD